MKEEQRRREAVVEKFESLADRETEGEISAEELELIRYRLSWLPQGVQALRTCTQEESADRLHRLGQQAFKADVALLKKHLPLLEKVAAGGGATEWTRVNVFPRYERAYCRVYSGLELDSERYDETMELLDRAEKALDLTLVGHHGVQALMELLKDRDPGPRAKAAFALSKMGWMAGSAVPALTEALNDENLRVRSWARFALTMIGQSRRPEEGAGQGVEHRTTDGE